MLSEPAEVEDVIDVWVVTVQPDLGPPEAVPFSGRLKAALLADLVGQGEVVAPD